MTRALLLLLSLLPAVIRASDVWRPFSNDSPWNTPIDSGAHGDRNSAALIDDLAARGAFHVNIGDWSIPVYFVDSANTPRYDVGDSRPGVYGAGFEFPRSIPIPDGAVPSPPVGENSDNHLCIIDRKLGLEWGMWAVRKNADGRWMTGLGAITDLRGTGVAPPWFDSPRQLDSHRARASGFPLIAGLIRLEEIKAGRIDHALVFAYDHCRTGLFIPPASTAQVTQLDAIDARGIPMGGRIQLDPSWEVETSTLSPAGKIIARALQKYGAYCGDYAGSTVFYAENSPEAVEAWKGVLSKNDLEVVFNPQFIREHFRVIDMGNLLPGQNLSMRPPYLIKLELSGHEPARIDPFERTVVLPGAAAVATAVWTTYPRDCSVVIDGREYASTSGDVPWGSARSFTLLAPDGSRSSWTMTREK